MKRFLVVALTILFTTTLSFAQSTTGRLIGTVSSPDGVLPGATIVLTDDKTGKERTVVTNNEGGFSFVQLEVGTYSVKVTANGFKTYQTNVTINVAQEYSLTPTLQPGNISETVTVTAGQDLVNSSNGELSTTVNERQLTELPLNGRNPLNLVLLQAGTASNPSQNTTINGFRTSSTNIIRDGVNIQDNFIRSNATDFAPGRPSVDDVGEFTLVTQAGADRGFGGPQVELVTPRGQNQFHGTLFEYNRNSKFGANNFFNNAAGSFGPNDALVLAGVKQVGDKRTPRAFRNRNQYGGNISGPVIKNKLFFFGYYEGIRDVVPANKLTTTLLPNARNGIFTYTRSDNGAIQTVNLFTAGILTCPTTNPMCNIPTGINAASVSRFISRLPAGNTPEAGDQRNTTGYRFSQASNTERNSYTTRIDYDITGNHSINGVFNYNEESNLRSDIDGSFNTIPEIVQPAKNKFLSLAWRSTWSSNFVNEARGGFLVSKPDFLRSNANPAFFVGTPLVTSPEVTFQEQGRKVDTINFADTADWIKGKHSMRFGGQFQSVKIDAYNDVNTVPTFGSGTNTITPSIPTSSFTNAALFPGGVPTAQRAGANNLVALLAGIITTGAQTFNVTSRDSGFVNGATQSRQFKYQTYAGFFNDQWRVTPSLTLNLGIRYELYTALESINGLFFEPAINGGDPVAAILNPAGTYQFIGGNAGIDRRFYKADKNNWAPVLSFAYAPRPEGGFWKTLLGDGKSVFRGGFRFSYINDELVRAPDNALSGNQGLSLGSNAIGPLGGTSTALNDRLGGTLTAIPVPTFSATRTYAQNNALANLFGTVFAVDPDIQMPRVTEYSFSYQRELPWNTAMEIRYVGNRSTNLMRGLDLNQVDISANGFVADFNRARSNLLINQAERTVRINALIAMGQTPAAATATVNAQLPESAAFNPALVGSVALTVFPNLGSFGLIGTAPGPGQSAINSAVSAPLIAGTPADLAILYVTNALSGTVKFLPNPNTGVVDLLTNGSVSYYNSLQAEVIRRFSAGWYIQANYTFSKTLTDGQGTGQTRFEPLLDNLQPNLEYSRADFDQTHVFNINTIYELPFGKGKRFLNQGGILNHIVGGWQVNAIMRFGSGSPITFTDARGTLNRVGRSGRQTALTSLTTDQLSQLVGTFVTQNGVFFINPTALGRDPVTGLTTTGNTGAGANGFGSTPFTGQVFFNNFPGQTSGLTRAAVNGPSTFNTDFSLFKNFNITERVKLQIRGEMFNAFNQVNFVPGQFLDINGTNFGRITGTFAPRVVQFAGRLSF